MPTWRQRLARLIAGPPTRAGVRMYGGARASRTTGYFGGNNTSADAELHHSLTTLRSRSRQMVRDSAYAKRAKAVVVNNVIGSGMGLQAQVENTRGEQADRVNTDIEHAWATWCRADSSHTGGTLHFGDLERAAMGEVFEAGEALLRLHFRAFGGSRVPLALELIEPERLAGDIDTHSVDPGNDLRMGVEVDRFFRPVAYWIRRHHVGDIRSRLTDYGNEVERVPAEQVFHMKLTTRWPQTRGEPWMHTVVRKIDDLDQYSQHEITAARASAAYFATIETPEDGSPNPLTTDTEADGTPLMDIEALTIQALAPGEKLAFHSPNRPNSAFDGFVRALLREIAAGVGTSYESLSRDYSQSNYSSSRLSLLDDRDGYRALQQWWIRSFREPLHRVWLQQAVLAGAIPAIPIGAYATDTLRYQAVRFKPRGWSWVDPTKEVTAYKEAIKAGLTTLTDVIAQTANGLDFEDVLATRKRELAMLDEAEVEVDTTVPEAIVPAAPQSIGQAADAEDDDADQAAGADASDDRARAARLVPLRRTA